jgi:streptogramin lyase
MLTTNRTLFVLAAGLVLVVMCRNFAEYDEVAPGMSSGAAGGGDGGESGDGNGTSGPPGGMAGFGGTRSGTAGMETNGGAAGNTSTAGNRSGGGVGGMAGESSQGGVGSAGDAGMSGDAGTDPGGAGVGGDGGWSASVEWFMDSTVLQPASVPTGLALDPDGNVWFTLSGSNRIGRLTPQGAMSAYPTLPQRDGSNAKPFSIVYGPDGNLWFTEENSDRIGCMTPNGETNHVDLERGRRPRIIVVGGDGNLWFTEDLGRRVGRLRPVCSAMQTGTVTEWTASTGGGRPWGLTAGTGDQIWFTVGGPERLGVVTASGPFLEIVLPEGAHPTYVVTHPNGSVWFNETLQDRVGRWQNNTLSHFALNSGSVPTGLTVDKRGNLWITCNATGDIIRMSPDGEILNVVPTSPDTRLHGILAANAAIWLTAERAPGIGRIKF